MNKFFALLIPLIFLLSFIFALIRKVRVYDSFAEGVKGVIPLLTSIFPYLATVTMLSQLLETSGFGARLGGWLSPFFSFVGIPQEIFPLILVKPLSGSGAIAVLSNILNAYGTDSYIGRCACVAYGSAETIFYIGAVYFAGLKRKKFSLALFISLLSYALAVVLCCFLCRIM